MLFGFAVGHFQQHVLRIALRERQAHLREMPGNQLQAKIRHQFEAGQRRAACAAAPARAAPMRRRGVCIAASAVNSRLGLRKQLEYRRGDDAERAFGADEQVAQVVAGVVLAQAAQAVPDLALRRDDFQAQA